MTIPWTFFNTYKIEFINKASYLEVVHMSTLIIEKHNYLISTLNMFFFFYQIVPTIK